MYSADDFSITFPRVLGKLCWEDEVGHSDFKMVQVSDARRLISAYFAEMDKGVVYEQAIREAWNTDFPNRFNERNVYFANQVHARLSSSGLSAVLGKDLVELESIPKDADLLKDVQCDVAASRLLKLLDDCRGVDAANATKLAYQKRPAFFPILDSFVRRSLGLAWIRGPFTPAFGKLLRQYRTFATSNLDLLTRLQRWMDQSPDVTNGLRVSNVRMLDILAWGAIRFSDPFR